MLELIRGKRLVFVGDSINRNQWESMLCMLMGAIRDPKRVFETHGRKITKEKGNYSFKFLVIPHRHNFLLLMSMARDYGINSFFCLPISSHRITNARLNTMSVIS